jgi:P27 family predicted phage terminase small subunit
VAPQLHAIGMLSTVDLAVLSAYCESYGRWRAAIELRGHGLIGPDGRVNPLIRIERQAALDMLKFGSELGLTPAARTRLGGAGGTTKRSGKFEGLIA